MNFRCILTGHLVPQDDVVLIDAYATILDVYGTWYEEWGGKCIRCGKSTSWTEAHP